LHPQGQDGLRVRAGRWRDGNELVKASEDLRVEEGCTWLRSTLGSSLSLRRLV